MDYGVYGPAEWGILFYLAIGCLVIIALFLATGRRRG